jgi:apolipoprotein D and lipocalin family protein
MTHHRVVSLLLLAPALLPSCASYAPLEVVEAVDVPRYLGTWYEIGSFPAWFQEGCHCSTAEYSPGTDEPIAVRNSCRRDSADGELDTADGLARPVDATSNARLEVSFARPFWGDYWIIELDAENYGWAVVGTPSREYLWILSRTPVLDEALLQELIARAAAKGFDMTRLQRTDQSCWAGEDAGSATDAATAGAAPGPGP